MSQEPPKTALRFLRWFCREDYLEEIEGDLFELFDVQASENLKKANRQFNWQVLLHFRPDFIKSFKITPMINTGILSNYLKTAVRGLSKHKSYTLINIAGLTTAMTCFLLIGFYIQYKLSYDQHHPNVDQLYRVSILQENNAFQGSEAFAVSPLPLNPALKEEFSEVEAVTSFEMDNQTLRFAEEIYQEQGLFTDPYFTDIFEVKVLAGAVDEYLSDPGSIILTKSLANKIFGKVDVIGQTLIFDNEKAITVRGVIEDLPKNQHFSFQYMTSYKNYPNHNYDLDKWNSNNYRTYLRLQEGYAPAALEARMSVFDKYLEPAYAAFPFQAKFFLQPVKDIHLKSKINMELGTNSDIRYLYLFACIALIILLLAYINYMNLTITRTVGRAKEVGIRKVMGAMKKQLVTQLISETMILSMISLVFAIGAVLFLIPSFSQLLDLPEAFTLFSKPKELLILMGIVLLIAGLSGLYPALFITNVSPTNAFSGQFLNRLKSGAILRNSLVIGQFTAAIILAAGSLIIFQQLQYVQEKKLGFSRDQIVYIPYSRISMTDHQDPIRNELMKHPQIQNVAFGNEVPIATTNQGIVDRWEGNTDKSHIYIYRNYVDPNYLDLFEIDLIEGRGLGEVADADSIKPYILNEAAVKKIGWESAVGKQFRDGQVVGVVKDYHFQTLSLDIEPLFITHIRKRYNSYGKIAIKIGTQNLESTLAHIQQTIKSQVPNLPYEYHFMDDSFNDLYQAERNFGQAFNIFTLLALFIACIGLLGLVAHHVVQRTKEIGIRKVLGASAFGIVGLLAKDFLKLVALALVIAIPIAWYGMQLWLEDFAYRITIQWWVFLLVGFATLLIAFLTIGTKSLKVALANPIKSIRNE
ncbi:MAG: ABC transporter permease [Saprospiraceae bacterium]